ncbi:MAG: type IX secretion system sortase PorU [Paludibacteraceae bacterium]|nr:type IX secretion system sortase PorU [Paludibacteraceae bacterium]
MRRLLILWSLVLLSLPIVAGIHTYADQSVLSSGHWVKIRVAESGVCRMTFSQLRQAGLNPQQLRVYGFGGAMLDQDFTTRKIDDLPQVPVFVGEDYVLFWVQGPISWKFNGTRFVHTRNPYSNYGYYFLSDNVGELLAPVAGEALSGTPTDVTTYIHYTVHEKDSLNLIDRSGVSGGGREFYGEQFATNQQRTFRLSTPNAVEGEQGRIYAALAGNGSVSGTFVSDVNGQSGSVAIAEISTGDFYTMANLGTLSQRYPVAANEQIVQFTYQNSLSSALGWLNYIEMNTPCRLSMVGSWMPLRTNVNYRTSAPVRFQLTDANAAIQVWDITDLAAIVRMPVTLEGTTLSWVGTQADGVHEYVAVNTNGAVFVSADIVGDVQPQNLHALKNIDYVIICPEGYETYATRLAQAHEQKQSITWAVVTDQQVYNEFSSGTPDATAYRWLMKMLYDRADAVNQKPRWLLLMGHGSFDNRNLLPNSGTSLLLTYEAKNSTNEVNAYATDDYFGFLDDEEGTNDSGGRMDIGVGRLPISTPDEAEAVVNKLIAYIRNEQAGRWKNQIVFLADDGEHGSHTETAEAGAEKVRVKNPDFVVNKIYLDAYPQEVNASGESYPLAKNRLDNLLKNGVLFFDYSGHGGYNAITNESMLSLREIEQMSNQHHAFWLFATCSFAHCDAGKRSAAEAAVLNPTGGAIGVLSACRTVYAAQNTVLNRNVCDTLFGHSNAFHYDMTIGEATAVGKNMTGNDPNKMAYVLLGDPAIRLNYPTDYQVETLTEMDTLNALSMQAVEGRIVDEDGLTVSDFDGKVDITIYDKMQVITTRDNDSEPSAAVELQYNDFPNTIFSGSATVEGGLFNYSFMVPKDIRYNFGNGRIVYYAYTHDSLDLAEAVGHFHQFIVGGSNSIVTIDTVGPQMTIYLNTPTFKDGDRTYATPRFFADLYDENGINTAGAGIGHDLMLIIDDNPKLTYSLNEYFTAESGSYQRGQVSYLMEALPDGPHSLLFRAWDMFNNSTTQTLNFIVDVSLDPSISSVTTYPNPVEQSGTLNLIVNYDQPDALLATEVYLYNLSGQMVWSHTQNNPDQVQIPLSQLGLQPGVYVYNVKLKSATSRYSSSAGKIIVTK